MRKPTTYFVIYEPDGGDEGEFKQRDFATLPLARRFKQDRNDAGYFCGIYKRTGIEDVTPTDDPPGLLWEWDEELIED